MTCYKKIGIFGGSFNPVHNGHTKIVNFFINELNLDCLYYVPTKVSPFKINQLVAKDCHRIQMIQNILTSKSAISMFEIKRNNPSYTIDTINYFIKKFKDTKFYLIIGSDLINEINKWKDIDQIAKKVNIVAAKRTKDISKSVNIAKYNIVIYENPIFTGSSTEIKKSCFQNVPKINQNYIAQNFLYIKTILKNTLSKERYEHSLSTASLAQKYATTFGLNETNAYFAGLCHDITKEWSTQRHIAYLKKYNFFQEALEPAKTLHQYTGYLWLKYEYSLKNTDILNAIKKHTTADIDMQLMDKIIYLADKLEKNRSFKDINLMRSLAFSDVNECFKLMLEKSKKYLMSVNSKISKKSENIFIKWSEEKW